QLVDRVAQGRLADMTTVCSSAEMLFLREGNDVTQLCKGHRQNLMESSITALAYRLASAAYFISGDAYHTPLHSDLPTARRTSDMRLHHPETKNAAYSRACLSC